MSKKRIGEQRNALYYYMKRNVYHPRMTSKTYIWHICLVCACVFIFFWCECTNQRRRRQRRCNMVQNVMYFFSFPPFFSCQNSGCETIENSISVSRMEFVVYSPVFIFDIIIDRSIYISLKYK